MEEWGRMELDGAARRAASPLHRYFAGIQRVWPSRMG